MVLLVILLLPAILAEVTELNINNYAIKIDDAVVKNIQANDNAADELDLSNLGLRSVEKGVFDNLNKVKTINLFNNSLSNLPEFIFSNLTNVEHISLANNEIAVFKNFFVGLKGLKTLNISNNPVKDLGKGWFFGLPKSTEIIVRGTSMVTINFGLFENPFLREEKKATKTVAESVYKLPEPEETPSEQDPEDMKTTQPLSPNFRVKVCIQDGKVTSLSALKKDELLTNDCNEVMIDYGFKKLSLRGLAISKFEKNWYRLQGFPISSIDLDGNAIVRLTSELLNDLPEGLREVTLRGNKIERLEKGIIDNDHLNILDLSNNFISEIEEGALEKTNLRGSLLLNGNRLKDTKFAATLPTRLTELHLHDNEITEVAAGSFFNLGKLSNLKLDGNNITEIQKQSLRGLFSIRYLSLSKNRLRKIEPGAFMDFSFLRVLDLDGNLMSSFEKNLFAGLDTLLTLRMNRNNFSKITRETMEGLSCTVHNLELDYNGIESLDVGSFEKVPILSLTLNGNKISKIDKGSFNLSTLRHLSLTSNWLSDVDGDAFEGLKGLQTLSVSGNSIKKIRKGFAKNLGGLQILDIAKNPIQRLENGDLYGFDKSGRRYMYVIAVPLEIIQGGLFDDV